MNGLDSSASLGMTFGGSGMTGVWVTVMLCRWFNLVWDGRGAHRHPWIPACAGKTKKGTGMTGVTCGSTPRTWEPVSEVPTLNLCRACRSGIGHLRGCCD